MSSADELQAPASDPGRRDLPPPPLRGAALSALAAECARQNVQLTFQGLPDAAAQWCGRSDAKDLDVHVSSADEREIDEVLCALGWRCYTSASMPGWLRHRMYAQAHTTDQGVRLGVIDVTVGDLRAGPVMLMEEAEILRGGQRSFPGGALGPGLAGAAGVCDVILRPLLRGRSPGREAFAHAHALLGALPGEERRGEESKLASAVSRVLGDRGQELTTALERGESWTASPAVLRAVRLRSLRRALSTHEGVRALAGLRALILPPLASHPHPLGVAGRGVLVVVLGTDGAGKSTFTSTLTELMRVENGDSFPLAPVYGGLGASSPRWLNVLRRGASRLSPAQAAGSARVPTEPPRQGTPPESSHPGSPGAVTLLHHLAAWAHLAAYASQAVQMERMRRRGVWVVCDRYVDDLALSPVRGGAASRLGAALLPRPDAVVLVEAAAAVVAQRLERRGEPSELSGIASRIEAYRSLLARRRRQGVPTFTYHSDTPSGDGLAGAGHTGAGLEELRSVLWRRSFRRFLR